MFSSVATREQSFTAVSSSVMAPVLRWEIRVASSCSVVNTTPSSGPCCANSGYQPRAAWSMRPCSSTTGSTAPGHREVVTDHDRVAPFFGGPAADPFAPGFLVAERAPQRQVVVGEVVLGQQVDLQRGLGDVGQPGIAGLPRLFDEVPALFVRHVVVREPLAGRSEMPIERCLDHGHELMEHGLGGGGVGVHHAQFLSSGVAAPFRSSQGSVPEPLHLGGVSGREAHGVVRSLTSLPREASRASPLGRTSLLSFDRSSSQPATADTCCDEGDNRTGRRFGDRRGLSPFVRTDRHRCIGLGGLRRRDRASGIDACHGGGLVRAQRPGPAPVAPGNLGHHAVPAERDPAHGPQPVARSAARPEIDQGRLRRGLHPGSVPGPGSERDAGAGTSTTGRGI